MIISQNERMSQQRIPTESGVILVPRDCRLWPYGHIHTEEI